MINVRTQVFGVEENVAELGHFRRHLGILQVPLTEAAQVVKQGIKRQFASSGVPLAWPPLKPSTIAQRADEGYGPGPILVREGDLMRSWTGGTAHSQKVLPTSITFGSTLRTKKGGHYLASIHHYGGTWSRGPVKAKKKGGRLRFYAGGTWNYRRSVGPATIHVPARPVIGVDGLPPAENAMVRMVFRKYIDRWMIAHGHPTA